MREGELDLVAPPRCDASCSARSRPAAVDCVRRAGRGGDASRSSGGCATLALRWLDGARRPRAASLRFDVASVLAARGAEPVDRGDRSRVLIVSAAVRGASRAGSPLRPRCQHPLCQWRRTSGASTGHDDLVTLTRRGSRGHSPGTGTPSPPGTAGRDGRRPRPGRTRRRGTRGPGSCQAKNAQPSRIAITTNAAATMTMSPRRSTRFRKGLKPTRLRYRHGQPARES